MIEESSTRDRALPGLMAPEPVRMRASATAPVVMPSENTESMTSRMSWLPAR